MLVSIQILNPIQNHVQIGFYSLVFELESDPGFFILDWIINISLDPDFLDRIQTHIQIRFFNLDFDVDFDFILDLDLLFYLDFGPWSGFYILILDVGFDFRFRL